MKIYAWLIDSMWSTRRISQWFLWGITEIQFVQHKMFITLELVITLEFHRKYQHQNKKILSDRRCNNSLH